MEKYYYNCKKFESYTSPCPHRDDPNLFAVRNWVQEGSKPNYLGEEINLAIEVCEKCDAFEPESL